MNSRLRAWTCSVTLLLAFAYFVVVGACAAEQGTHPIKPYDLDDPAEPWRTSKSGIITKIMPPYTPLVREANQVQCWGRSYGLNGLFPTAVASQGQWHILIIFDYSDNFECSDHVDYFD